MENLEGPENRRMLKSQKEINTDMKAGALLGLRRPLLNPELWVSMTSGQKDEAWGI